MATVPNPVPPEAAPPRRSPWRHVWRGALVVLAAVALLIGAAAWYASTPQFANRVRTELISVIERATGGRVELGAFHWSVLHLQFEVDNLTIHGLEGPGQVPYAHVDRAFVQVKILSFFRPKISLNYLGITHPVFHLIVNADGSTNQPHPKVASTSNTPIQDTLLDLAVDRTEANNGSLLLDEQAVEQRAIPFDIAANQIGVTVRYVPAPLLSGDGKSKESYAATVHIEDLTATRVRTAPVKMKFDVQASIGRNFLTVESLRLQTGESTLNGDASVTNFADPAWKGQAQGKVDLREVEALSEIEGLNRGQATLQLTGQGTRRTFTVDGNAGVEGATYHVGSIHIAGARATAQLHMTHDEIALTAIKARLATGGTIDAEMHILRWLSTPPSGAVPDLPPATTRALRKAQKVNADKGKQQGIIRAKLRGLSLYSIMSVVAPAHYANLGFDTAASGDASVDWTGSALDFTANAKVALTPTGRPRPNEVPLHGTIDAGYSNVTGLVSIRGLNVQTPGMNLQVTGSLGAYPITRSSSMQVKLTTNNLAEFDQTLTTLGLAAEGKTGVKAIPLALHGQAAFDGVVTRSILDPDVQGHLNATNFDLLFNAPVQSGAANAETPGQSSVRTVHWDSADAQAEYSSDLIAVQHGVLQRGKTAVHLAGQLHAHQLPRHRYAFDENSAISANVGVQDAALADLLVMAGQDLPVSGTLNLQANVNGQLNNLSGGGHVAINGGAAYGEPYHSLNADLRFAGEEVGATHLVFLQNGGQLSGDGGYDLGNKNFHFNARGSGFELAHIQRLKNSRYTLGGMLVFDAQGSGTLESPSLQANIHLSKLNFDNKASGYLDINAHTQGHTLLMKANAQMSNAAIQAQGQVQLTGDYQTQAQLTLTGLDVDPILESLAVRGVTVHSTIAGNVKVNGPLKYPRKLSGDATLAQFEVALGGIPLKSQGPLHGTLADGRLRLDPLHIVGEDTDLRANGAIGVFDQDRELNLHADGSVNMKLAQTLDTDLTSSGHVDFDVDADGSIMHPSLTGQVKFTNVAMALQDFPNGLSQMNGTLSFDQDRLDVKDLTAVSGGGKLKMGGFVTYQQGLYADLNATAKDVRIRYPQGISSMADAKMRLLGTQASLLLSGTVTVTRFVIGSDLDLASFSSATGSVSLPPDPNSPSNRLRLDIHILSAPQLDFQNSYAKLAGDVDLRVRGTLAQPSVLGHISVTEGSATFAGTKYELQHGDIYFTNPLRIDPVIDLSAMAHVEDYDITIGLNGTPSKLVPTFRSEPPLSEQDIFALLALGRTQEEQQIYSSMQSQAGVNSTADTLLGGALNATVSSRIQKLFGGGSVKIDPTFVSGTGNSTARITVEQQISKNATLTYATNVNSTAQQLIQGQVNLTENISILAVRDESGVFSLLFKIRRRYR
ncbi:translocation and assembly module TamB [Silvibacterium bohemicum]|uniref:Translocation and assembly module TamB n=1 Tax=Silvibacterium bohemicum TaxID=1577686 RepID=A0A841JWE3_9BACT|nr:translocation/assembly module TamB domain-containing protein [Silvibacterium bohemicum]MBB6144049.1 translocation and assembly module TamB [Silvibacterium bohemicum]